MPDAGAGRSSARTAGAPAQCYGAACAGYTPRGNAPQGMTATQRHRTEKLPNATASTPLTLLGGPARLAHTGAALSLAHKSAAARAIQPSGRQNIPLAKMSSSSRAFESSRFTHSVTHWLQGLC